MVSAHSKYPQKILPNTGMAVLSRRAFVLSLSLAILVISGPSADAFPTGVADDTQLVTEITSAPPAPRFAYYSSSNQGRDLASWLKLSQSNPIIEKMLRTMLQRLGFSQAEIEQMIRTGSPLSGGRMSAGDDFRKYCCPYFKK